MRSSNLDKQGLLDLLKRRLPESFEIRTWDDKNHVCAVILVPIKVEHKFKEPKHKRRNKRGEDKSEEEDGQPTGSRVAR